MDEDEREELAAMIVTAVMDDLRGRQGVLDALDSHAQEDIAMGLRHRVESLLSERGPC